MKEHLILPENYYDKSVTDSFSVNRAKRIFDFCSAGNMDKTARILDIGCGGGGYLRCF